MAHRFARATVGAAVLGLGLVGTAGIAAAVTVHPLTASNCGTQYNYETCIYIEGSGAYVSYWQATSVDQVGTLETRFVSLDGPNGFHVCSGNLVKLSGIYTESACTGSPDKDEPTGTYCARTYVYGNGSGYFTDGTDCTNVS